MLIKERAEKDFSNKEVKFKLVVPYGEEVQQDQQQEMREEQPVQKENAAELFEQVKNTDLFKSAINSAVEEATSGLRQNRDDILAEKKELESYKKMFKQAADDAELAEALKSGDTSIKKLLDDRVSSARSDMQKLIENKDNEINSLREQIAGADQRLKDFRIKDVVGSAALKNEFFQKTAVDDLMVLARQTWDMDDNGALVPRDGTGNVIIGNDGNAVTPESWVSSLTESKPHYFKTMTGSGASGGSQNVAGATYSRSEWQQKILSASKTEKQQLLKARDAGEVKITG